MSKLIHRPRFGAGSIVMIVGLVAFGLYGYLSQPGPIKSTYYEADATGNLKLVDRPSLPAQKPLVPLARLKPEPTLILDHASRLGLQPAQSKALAALAKSWQEKREAFQVQMGQSQKAAEPTQGSRSSINHLKSGLADYSRLSVEYDLERQEFWNRSLAVLTDAQRLRLARYLAGGNL